MRKDRFMGLKVDTKRILVDAFCDLLEKKSLEDISVQNIVDECGASRTTFYNHFLDKYDLMLWIYKEDMKSIWENFSENWDETNLEVLNYFKKKKTFYLNISQYAGQNSIQEEMKERLIGNAREYFRKRLDTIVLSEEIEHAIEVYSRNVIEEIFDWLRTPCPCSSKKLLRNMSVCMPFILVQCLDNVELKRKAV